MLSLKGKIPIHIYPFFIIVAMMIGWLNTMTIQGMLIWFAIITVSVLVHEFGHALTAVYFGQTAQIELVGLGGLTQRKGPPLKKWQDFVVILNGPCAGFLLAALAFYLGKRMDPSSPMTEVLAVTFYVNVFWTIVNLLPVQPLDGGHLLAIVLQGIFGFRGVKFALLFSIFFATAISLLFFAMKALLAGSLFLLFAFESYRTWKSTLAIKEQDRDFNLQQLLQQAEDHMEHGEKEEAIQLLREIRTLAKSGLIYGKATENLAFLLAEKGDYTEAYDLLLPLKNAMTPPSLLLLHQLALRLEQWKAVTELGSRLYRLFPQEDVALRNAIACAAMGQAFPAVGWLQRAEHEGARDLHEVLERHEFDSIRRDPAFIEWEKGRKG